MGARAGRQVGGLEEPVRPDNHVRRYRGVREELVVYGTLSEDGATTVHLRSGPCAPFMGGFDPSVYEVDDGS